MEVSTQALTHPDTGLTRAFLRRFDLKAGEHHEGHEHDIDHGTVVHSGRIRVDWKNARGSGTKEFVAPANLTIRADTFHTITALEDSSWYCVFTPPEGYEDDLREFWNERGGD